MKLIRSAKKETDKLEVGISYLNLLKIDKDLEGFDSNLKVKPILRGQRDRKALIAAVVNGTVDYISSNHVPREIEAKHLEYTYAAHGATGLETCFAAMMTNLSEKLDIETIIEKLTTGPRKIFNIPDPIIEEGEMAKLTLFDPMMKWTFARNQIKSLSQNNPFIGEEFVGKVVGTINRSIVKLQS